jgi:CheY-like chemotaxis protein
VETVLDGAAAFDAVTARYDAAQSNPRLRQYDCVLMATEFAGGSVRWDGLQAIRVIRDWEAQLQASGYNTTRIPIVAMTKLRDLINDKAEVEAAGADLLLTQATTGYVATADLQLPVEQPEATHTTEDMYEKAHIRSTYNDFAAVVLKFLARSSSDVLITATNSAPLAGALPPDVLAGLQGMTVGSTITIQGTVQQVNAALTSVFYFAPNNTQGNITFTVTVTDQAAPCILPEALRYVEADPTSVTQPATYALLPTHGFNQSANMDRNASSVQQLVASLCDQVGAQTVTAHIPLFVVAVNQAPVLSYEGAVDDSVGPTFNVTLDASVTVPTVSVDDADHSEGERGAPLLSSFGLQISPPVTVTVTAQGGRVSFPQLEYHSPTLGPRIVSVTTGQGRLDKHTVLRGPLDAINHALAAMRYVCRGQDGCVTGYRDTITIVANDEGFSGKGGALTDTLTIAVQVA